MVHIHFLSHVVCMYAEQIVSANANARLISYRLTIALCRYGMCTHRGRQSVDLITMGNAPVGAL